MGLLDYFRAPRLAVGLLVYLAAAFLVAFPMILATVPLGVDDLNHLSRIYILSHVQSDRALQHYFEIRHELIPYLGMDVLLAPLAHVLPIMIVGRLFVVFLGLSLVGVVAYLRFSFTGRIGILPAAAGIMTYNSLLALGLLDYLLGVTVALFLFALWHNQRESPWFTRLLCFAVGSTLLYLVHLLGFGLYLTMVGSYEFLGRKHPFRMPLLDGIVLIGQVIPPILLFSFFILDNPLPPLHYYTRYEPVILKPWILISPFLFNGTFGGPDWGSVTAVVVVFLLFLAAKRNWVSCPRLLFAPALVLLMLAVLLPYKLFGLAYFDYRFPLPAAYLILSGLQFNRLWLSRFLAGTVILLFPLQVMGVATVVSRCDRQYQELSSALHVLPRGAQLTTVLEKAAPRPAAECSQLPVYKHIAQLATIERSGYATDFFSYVTSLEVRDGLATDTDPIPAEKFLTAPKSGYVLWLNLGHPRAPPPNLVLIKTGSFFAIFAADGGK